MEHPPRRACTGARLVAIATLLLASVSAAVDVADEAEFHFRRGLTSFKQGHYEDALASFYASNRLVPNRAAQGNIASTLVQLRMYDEAYRVYAELQRAPLSEEQRQAVDHAIQQLRPKVALVRVESQPPGATIYVGRRDLGALGVTPKVLALRPGPTRVLLELDGFRPVVVEADVVKGGEISLAPALERIHGELELPGLPLDAEVRRDHARGELLRTGPGRLRLVPGHVTLVVVAPGFLTERVESEVKPDAVRNVEISLVPAPPPMGALVVKANAEGALIQVDGKAMGFSPAVIERVPAGRRRIRVSKEGREPVELAVDLADQERRNVDVKLPPLEQQVTGATQRALRIQDAPASVSVITARELKAFGYTTVAEALRSVRGLYGWTDRANEVIGVHGFGRPGNEGRVLVLLNGHPMNEGLQNRGPIGHELGLDLLQVERIEVVRGGGMVYGTVGYLGLINVVTRRPAPGVHGSVGTRISTHGGLEGQLAASIAGDAAELMVTATAGQEAGDRHYGTAVTLADGADRETWRSAHLIARAGPFSLTAGISRRGKAVPTGLSETAPVDFMCNDNPELLGCFQPTGEYALASGHAFAAGSFERTYLDGSRIVARLAYDVFDKADRLPTMLQTLHDRGEASRATAEGRFEWAISTHHRLTIGAELRWDASLVQELRDGTHALLFADRRSEWFPTLYVGYDYVPSEKLRLTAGLRYDPFYERNPYAERSGPPGYVKPLIGLVLTPYSGGNTKLLVDYVVRGPSVRERYSQDGVSRRAPESLYPEERLGLVLEHSHAVSEDLSLTGSMFVSSHSDVVAAERESSSGNLVYFTNRVNDRIAGAEAELRYTHPDGALLAIAYSRRMALEAFEFAPAVNPPPNSPAHVASARALLPVLPGALSVASELVFTGGRNDLYGKPVDDSLIMNLVATGDYTPWRLSYHAGVFNALNDRSGAPVGAGRRCEVHDGELFCSAGSTVVPQPGRSLRAGLTWSW